MTLDLFWAALTLMLLVVWIGGYALVIWAAWTGRWRRP